MKKLLILSVVALTATSCAIAPSNHGFALIGDTVEAVNATTNTSTKKVGKSCGKNYLGLVATGDSSVSAAKRDGGISTVTSIDKEVKRYVLMSEVCTVVKGN